jgi:hypothetical protein
MRFLLSPLFLVLPLACPAESPVAERLASRGFPSVFQAWNPLDMPTLFPGGDENARLSAAARHDVLWEEPVSQLGFGTPLVLGAVWEGPHAGLSNRFTAESLRRALENRRRMLSENPAMVFLLEVRWRDAPGSFLPETSPFWHRGPDGRRLKGWDNGPEPYYLLDPENPEFRANIARQCRIAVESGVYDGIMIDWSGHEGVVADTRRVLGSDPIIIVNIHDSIEDADRYRGLINGSFMECNPEGPGAPVRNNQTTWDRLRAGYLHMEAVMREPRVNCLEVWGERGDFRRMRAATTLALTHGNGSVLFADPNPLPTPDHLHDWYEFWDADLGRPTGPRRVRADGLVDRPFEKGVAVYNHFGNGDREVVLSAPHRRVSTGEVVTAFVLADADGEILLPSP